MYCSVLLHVLRADDLLLSAFYIQKHGQRVSFRATYCRDNCAEQQQCSTNRQVTEVQLH